MAIVSSLFLILALTLAVLFGPQTHPWPWGPALVALGLAVLSAVPVIWRSKRFPDTGLILSGAVVAAWFGWRAWVSPVGGFAVADLLLLAGAVGSFIVVRCISESETAIRVFTWGLALLLLASVLVIARQVAEPSFNPIFSSRPDPLPSGFYGHYNEGANFLIAASFLLAASALVGRHATLTRVVWGLIALAGLAAVYFTRSRSGMLSVGVGGLAFIVMLLLCGKREKSRWFAPLLIALPVLAGIAIAFVAFAWLKAQEVRSYEGGIAALMDNSIRLHLAGIAMSCIAMHPWAGGGSGSFSWECYQFWGIQENGWTTSRPELVHNELLQAFTDYGIVGGLLITGFLVAVVISAVLRSLFPENPGRPPQTDAMHVGGIAALSAMLVHSGFNFVFHLMPGVILLGICLGRASLPLPSLRLGIVPKQTAPKICLTVAAIAIAAAALPFGWKGCRVLYTLRATYFEPAKNLTLTGRAYALDKAIAIWPRMELYKDRALLLHKIAHDDLTAGRAAPDVDEAIASYRAGLALHPYEIGLSINLANLLGQAGRDEEAVQEYERAIGLQGGMELGFKAHFHATNHLLKMGIKQLDAGDSEKAVETLSMAASQFDEAAKGYPSLPLIAEGITLRSSIREELGKALEHSGDLEGALETYNELAESGDTIGDYRAGLLLGKTAKSAWLERRSSEALSGFLEARRRAGAATRIPPGVTPAIKDEYLAYLDEMIKYLVDAKVEPLKKDGD